VYSLSLILSIYEDILIAFLQIKREKSRGLTGITMNDNFGIVLLWILTTCRHFNLSNHGNIH